jgi:multidrug efflux system outer membrane protein
MDWQTSIQIQPNKQMKTIIKNITFAGALAVLAACNVTKPYRAPDAGNTALFRGYDGTNTGSIAKLHWNQVFTDTILQNLITEGISHNIDLQKAYSVTRQAQAYFDQSKLAFYPSVGADAGLSLSGSANPQNFSTPAKGRVYSAELTASWEADIWGKLKSAKKAQLASLLQSTTNARAVQTTLIADIANNYYNLMALDQQLAITEQSVKNWQATVNTMKSLKIADVVTGAAVVQSEASKYAVQVTIPDLKQSIWQTENIINLLLGRVPGPIKRSKIDVQQPITILNLGIPAQMLANRPDVMAAEYSFRNAYELTNVARTYFYPSITLSGSGGYSGYSSFFGLGSLVGNLTAGIVQPIFNQGANKTRLQVAKEQQQQALLNFQYTVLSAGQDVSNAMMSYQTAGEKATTRVIQLENLEKSVNYTQQLVRFGSANYTEVLTAEQNLLTTQLNSVNDRLQQLQAIVFLYRSLGGGWQ